MVITPLGVKMFHTAFLLSSIDFRIAFLEFLNNVTFVKFTFVLAIQM